MASIVHITSHITDEMTAFCLMVLEVWDKSDTAFCFTKF